MPQRHFVDFDITIRRNTVPAPSAHYPVTASYRSRLGEGTFTQGIDDDFWRTAVAQLFDPAQSVGSQRLMEIGGQLYDHLMQGAIRDLWISARSDLDAGTVPGIRLRLAIQPPAVASLPWEALCDRDRNEPFAASGRTPLVRVENLFRHVGASRPLRTHPPMKLLVAAPTDPTGQIDAEYEIGEIERVAATLGANLLQVVSFSGRFDVVELRREIESQQPDILHLIGHGKPEAILLWKQDEPAWAPANALRVVLQRTSSIKLVVLNVCLAGRVSERAPFTTVGPQILQAGVPAVVAMQFEVLEREAAHFASYLYEELIAGPAPGAIDAAVGYARSNLYALDPDSFGFGAPVLWLNAEDGVIFEMAPPAAAEQEVQTAKHRHHTEQADQPEEQKQAMQHSGIEREPTPAIKVSLLQQQEQEIARWLAAQPDVTVVEADATMRNLLTMRNNELQNVWDQFRQLRGFKDEQLRLGEPTHAVLLEYQSRLERIGQKRQRVDSMNRMIRQQRSLK